MSRVLVSALALAWIVGCGAAEVADEGAMQQILGQPTVYTAAQAGDLQAVREFIESNEWDPQRPDGAGVTPLNYAAVGGNVEIIRLMVQNGADVNQADIHRNTPLMSAQKAGKTEAVNVLKELGATE